ncbi:hypothetical protein SRHO_G00337540 [Serrasalmus rhombeus]
MPSGSRETLWFMNRPAPQHWTNENTFAGHDALNLERTKVEERTQRKRERGLDERKVSKNSSRLLCGPTHAPVL